MRLHFSNEFKLGESDNKIVPLISTAADAERALASLYESKRAIREESESYPAVVLRINSDWRLIICKDAIQWILQKQSGTDKSEPRWRGLKYNRTKMGLVRSLRDCGLHGEPVVQWMVGLLPERL